MNQQCNNLGLIRMSAAHSIAVSSRAATGIDYLCSWQISVPFAWEISMVAPSWAALASINYLVYLGPGYRRRSDAVCGAW